MEYQYPCINIGFGYRGILHKHYTGIGTIGIRTPLVHIYPSSSWRRRENSTHSTDRRIRLWLGAESDTHHQAERR